jgi:hypothetical protein
MNKDDAEEFTQSLGQIAAGTWRQVALAKRLGVPAALGLSVEEWVNERLGGYIKMNIDERRAAVADATAEGYSAREIAGFLGVSHDTVSRDVANATAYAAACAELEMAADLSREALAALRSIGKPLAPGDADLFAELVADMIIAHEIDGRISVERTMQLVLDTPKSEIAAELEAMHIQPCGSTATLNACRAMRDFAVGLT